MLWLTSGGSMETVLDIETTFTTDEKGRSNPSTFIDANKLVSVGYWIADRPNTIYYWKAKDAKELLQYVLDNTTLLIGHNIKFDLQWLLECGFHYSGKLWDTMQYEYIK